MQKILLPIKDKYSQDILSEKKKFELRRNIPKQVVEKIVIYSTSPVKKVVGEAWVKTIHELPLSKLWDLTKESNSVSEEEFYSYYKGKKKGFAYEISKVRKFKNKKSLSEYNINYVPQGFVYLKYENDRKH